MTEPETVREVRGLARDFAETRLRPGTEAWDAAGALDDAIPSELAELGFFGMLVPEEAGGMGFEMAVWVAALEEIAWGDAAVAVLLADTVIAADMLARFGEQAQQERWLGSLAAGEALACLALAPPAEHGDSGEGLTAEASADGWRLSGRRRWVVNGDRAALALVGVSLDGQPALLAIPRDAGWSAGERALTLGLRPLALVDLELDGVQFGEPERLGGFDGAAAAGSVARLSGAAIAVGIARAALEHAVRYAAEREQFGVPIRTFEGIQHKLAEMATRTAAARLLLEQAARDPADVAASAMAKLAAGECAMFAATEAVQVFGGYGYMRDYPVEKLMRDAKALQIMHGPSEVQRRLIARSLYE
jgi:alkylation response protein AidB-like acyl-CoA dehydrogenase